MDIKTNKISFSDFSPRCLVRMLVRNLWLIAAGAAILAMAESLYLSWFQTPVYQAAMTYAVTAREGSVASGSNVTASKEVAAVMTELLGTDVIAQKLPTVHEKLSGFDGVIQAKQVEETNMITVTAQASTAEQAFLALDALVKIFPELSDYLSETSVAQVIRNPMVSQQPVNAVSERSMMIRWGAIGAAAMMVLLVWISIARETVQTREGARRLLDASILATVEHERKNRTLRAALKNLNKGLQVFAPTTSAAYTEQINSICAQVEHEADLGSRIFLITGAGENEGKSTIAGNVAAALSMRGKRVALVDCDLRNPSLNSFFDKKYTALLPLNEMLAQTFSRDNLLQCMQLHDKLGIFMLFSTRPDKRCAELLAGETMDLLLRQLRVFDVVILDTPPMGYFADAEALAEKSDASILVVRQDRTPVADINNACEILRASASKFMGCVLNDMTSSMTEGYGYGAGYGYGKYGYGKYGYGKYGYGKNHYGYGYGYGYGEEHSHKKHSHSRKGG